MKKSLRLAYSLMRLLGLDPLKAIDTIRALPLFIRDLSEFKRQQEASNVPFTFGKLYPCLDDRLLTSGTAQGHYFYHDLLVAMRIFKNSPELHIDIGSRIDGFVSHVASYREIEVFDIRPQRSNFLNIKFNCADLMGNIDDRFINYCDSLSCLNALEHFGLGRYGDPIKFDGYIDALNNMHSMLKKKGKFYLAVPIGPQRIEFNGQRVFSLEYIIGLLEDRYLIDFFSYIDDAGDLHENVQLINSTIKENLGCHYGCGIWEMSKL